MNSAKSTLTLNKVTETHRHPHPDDFDQYLPWAYNQMEGDTGLVVIRMMQHEYINLGRSTERSKAKCKRSKVMHSPTNEEDKTTSWQPLLMTTANVVRIIATYDYADNLVHIKFDRNITISRKVMNLISYVLQFQPHLTGVTINKGMDMYTLYELNRWLPISGITDICLDDTFVEEGNYHVLLESQSSLKNLSLARCKINDSVLMNIASKLMFPLPASKTLSLLNLSSNRITDLGVKHLSDALRSNRKLYYLNLANNMISDEGVLTLLNIITEFPLKADEIMTMRSIHMKYMKQKTELSKRILKDLKAGEYDKKLARRKSVKPSQITARKLKGVDREHSARGLVEGATKSLVNMEVALLEKAETMAVNMLGGFEGPFTMNHTKMIDGITHCLGNNALCYLNLAYNNLSFISVKRLMNVVLSQKLMDRKPRGLVNVCIEGNNIPIQCTELANIDEILESGLRPFSSKVAMHKRKSISRGSTK